MEASFEGQKGGKLLCKFLHLVFMLHSPSFLPSFWPSNLFSWHCGPYVLTYLVSLAPCWQRIMRNDECSSRNCDDGNWGSKLFLLLRWCSPSPPPPCWRCWRSAVCLGTFQPVFKFHIIFQEVPITSGKQSTTNLTCEWGSSHDVKYYRMPLYTSLPWIHTKSESCGAANCTVSDVGTCVEFLSNNLLGTFKQ